MSSFREFLTQRRENRKTSNIPTKELTISQQSRYWHCGENNALETISNPRNWNMKCSRNGKKFIFWKEDNGNPVYVHGERDSKLIRTEGNPAALSFRKNDTRVFKKRTSGGDSKTHISVLQHVSTGYFVGPTNQEGQITLQKHISDAVDINFDIEQS